VQQALDNSALTAATTSTPAPVINSRANYKIKEAASQTFEFQVQTSDARSDLSL
jgi:hypothetical protein